MLVDSHCHLDHLDLSNHQNSLDNILDNARARGVERFLTVGVDLNSSAKLIELASGLPDVMVSVGVHPLQQKLPPIPRVEELVGLACNARVVAIGETGLDYHYAKDNAAWQQESFHCHLQASCQTGKPVIVHTREAREDTLQIIGEYSGQLPGGVLHCFTESWEMAKAALDFGFYISFSGIITFRNAEQLREVVSKVPLERMLVETDSPWLAPVPYRGKQNQPAYVVEVAEAVARIKRVSVDEVVAQTGKNFFSLFSTSPH